jgi:hypothetical protein
VGREMAQVVPVGGSYVGGGGDLLRLTVAVRVTQLS